MLRLKKRKRSRCRTSIDVGEAHWHFVFKHSRGPTRVAGFPLFLFLLTLRNFYGEQTPSALLTSPALHHRYLPQQKQKKQNFLGICKVTICCYPFCISYNWCLILQINTPIFILDNLPKATLLWQNSNTADSNTHYFRSLTKHCIVSRVK